MRINRTYNHTNWGIQVELGWRDYSAATATDGAAGGAWRLAGPAGTPISTPL